MRRRGTRLGLLVGALTAALSLDGCAGGLLFIDDHLITIDSPTDYQSVTEPVLLSWHLRSGAAAPASLAVFVDRDPQAPGDLLSTFKNRDGITVLPGTATSMSLDHLRVNADAVSDEQRRQHSATLVVLDADGRRSSESSAYVQFLVGS